MRKIHNQGSWSMKIAGTMVLFVSKILAQSPLVVNNDQRL